MLVNDLALCEQIVVLAGHLAWPVTTIILLLLARRLIAQIVEAIVVRISDNRSGFEMGPGGIKVGAIVEATLPGQTDTGKKLKAKIDANPNFRQQLEKWLQGLNPDLTVTSFLDGANHEDLRKKAVLYFEL